MRSKNAVGCLIALVTLLAFWPRSTSGVNGLAFNCALRREISPCTCSNNPILQPSSRRIQIKCEGISSFRQVVDAITNKFDFDVIIELFISQSALDDLPELSFEALNLRIFLLDLKKNNLSALPQRVFFGLNYTESFSLLGNMLREVPRDILNCMPHIKTLDLSYNNIQSVRSDDFSGLHQLKAVILKGNNISMLEIDCFPNTISKIQLSQNLIPSLNGTLRNLTQLEWLIVNLNQLASLDGELPEMKKPMGKLIAIMAADNRLTNLTEELANFPLLDSFHLEGNNITSLDGRLKHLRKMNEIHLTHNNISILGTDDFAELTSLDTLKLGWNRIRSVNGSLSRLKNLKHLNLTRNELGTFPLSELQGLRHLETVDLSHNRMHTLIGVGKNRVVSEVYVQRLFLEFNDLVTLSGSLMGLNGLELLSLGHNLIQFISPEDLIGLDSLKTLDLSYNSLTRLYETSKTVLPALESLNASHNMIGSLEKDFYGLPKLCRADLSFNTIQYIDPRLAENTKCLLHGASSTLRIYLHSNPLLCSEDMSAVIRSLQSKTVEIYGETVDCRQQQTFNVTTEPSSLLLQPQIQMVNDVAPPEESYPATINA